MIAQQYPNFFQPSVVPVPATKKRHKSTPECISKGAAITDMFVTRTENYERDYYPMDQRLLFENGAGAGYKNFSGTPQEKRKRNTKGGRLSGGADGVGIIKKVTDRLSGKFIFLTVRGSTNPEEDWPATLTAESERFAKKDRGILRDLWVIVCKIDPVTFDPFDSRLLSPEQSFLCSKKRDDRDTHWLLNRRHIARFSLNGKYPPTFFQLPDIRNALLKAINGQDHEKI